jgi:hypothetical protein
MSIMRKAGTLQLAHRVHHGLDSSHGGPLEIDVLDNEGGQTLRLEAIFHWPPL